MLTQIGGHVSIFSYASFFNTTDLFTRGSSPFIQSMIHCLHPCSSVGFTSLCHSQVASLRQKLEEIQGRRGGGGRGGGDGGGGGVRDGTSARGGCGPEAPCSRSLAAMEHAQRQALEELQRQHERQMKEVENEKNRLLLEETQDTTRGQHIPMKSSFETKTSSRSSVRCCLRSPF